MKHFQIANVIISIAICFIVFINIAVFVLVYIVWMFAYIFGIIHIPNNSHRKMYALKKQNGWIIEAQRKKVYIDTRVSAGLQACRQSLFPDWNGAFPKQGRLGGVQSGFSHLARSVLLHAFGIFHPCLFLEVRFVPEGGGICVRRLSGGFRAFFLCRRGCRTCCR